MVRRERAWRERERRNGVNGNKGQGGEWSNREWTRERECRDGNRRNGVIGKEGSGRGVEDQGVDRREREWSDKKER